MHLQEHLGFRCDSLLLYNNTEEKGIGFTSFIRNMENCTTDAGTIRISPECPCHMGVGGWMLNRERLGRVDYLPPFVIDGYEVLVHVDSTSSSTGGAFFLTAFSVSVWGSVFALFVVFTFLKLLDRRFAPPDQSFTPLPATEPRSRRLKHFLLKSRIPLRFRKAVQSTRTYQRKQSHSFLNMRVPTLMPYQLCRPPRTSDPNSCYSISNDVVLYLLFVPTPLG